MFTKYHWNMLNGRITLPKLINREYSVREDMAEYGDNLFDDDNDNDHDNN